MDRRSIIMALACGAAAGPALAQNAAHPKMTQAELEHSTKTAMVGAASLETSNIALEKAKDAKVKEFAKFEHDEQTTVAEILKSMGLKPPGPDPKMTDVVQKLKGMAAGAEFDRMFVTAQIEAHQMLRQIQEDYLKVGKDREHIAITKLVLGMVKEHLALLDDLKKMA